MGERGMAVGLQRQLGQLYGVDFAVIIAAVSHSVTANQWYLSIEVLAGYQLHWNLD